MYISNVKISVLIDTWWNVNNPTAVLQQPLKVLIDTWWNVNKIFDIKPNTSIGFNRYMVECESVHLLTEAKAKGF